MESTPTPVAPVRPAAAYIGGKKNLARRLTARIEATPHRLYAEPFVGMGGVFLRRRLRPKCEVINDLSRDVATLYRVLQRHYEPLMDLLKWRITSRTEFERLTAQDPDTLTDLERAARFLYLQRLAFGGKVTGRNFGVSSSDHRPGRFDVVQLRAELAEIHDRLAGVIVERLPWAELIARYDTPETLFYLDPPYHRSEGDYGAGMFSAADFARMAEVLGAIRGRFILSINDTPEVRAWFAAFQQEPVGTHYGLAGKGMQAARELIIIG